MTTLATMQAAALRLLGYYNGNDYSADNPGGMSGVGGMATNWEPCIQDIGTVANGVGEVAGTIAAAQSTIALVWDAATAAADPGTGKLRATTATPALGSYSLLVSAIDSAGAGIGAMLSELGSSSSATKARARLVAVGDASKYLDLQVTGVSGAGAYRIVAVTCIGGPGDFAAGDAVALGWARTGDKGDTGSTSVPAGTLAAPGLAVTGDSNTGLVQLGGGDTLSAVAGGAEIWRIGTSFMALGGAPGAESLRVNAIANAVDRIEISGGAAGAGVSIAAAGTSPSIAVYYASKGTAGHHFTTGGFAAEQLELKHVANAVAHVTVAGAAAGGVATVSTSAGDLNLTSASGVVRVNGSPMGGGLFAGTASKSADYTVIASDARYLIECTAPLTLPLTAAATLGSGFTFGVWNNSTGTVVVDPSGAESINGGATLTLSAGQWAIVTNTGTAWKALVQTAQSPCAFSATDKEGALIVINGGLTAYVAAGGVMQSGRAIIALAGQRYFEVVLDAVASSGLSAIVGIATGTAAFGATYGLATSAGGYGYASDTGNKLNNSTQAGFGSAWNGLATVIGVAYDDVSTPGIVKVWFSVNGVWQASGNPATGANPAFSVAAAVFYPAITCKNGGQVSARFSASSWAFAAPTGFKQIS